MSEEHPWALPQISKNPIHESFWPVTEVVRVAISLHLRSTHVVIADHGDVSDE